MKSLVAALIVITFIPMFLLAQKKAPSALVVSDKQFALSSVLQAQKEATVLPFLEGRTLTGSKEQFGLLFKSVQGKNSFIEILTADGKVSKSITLNDFLGKVTTNDVKMLSNTISSDNRFTEAQHEIALPSGKIKLITKGIASGDETNPNFQKQIVITFSLVSSTEQNLSLRLLLPVEGTAEVKENGIVLSGKKAAASIALAVLPKGEKIELQKNILSLKSNAVSVNGETPLLWLVASGSSAPSLTASKTAAAAQVDNMYKTSQEPHLIILNSVSKANAQPGDTVVYTLTCKNIGVGDATNIQLTNPIPAGTSYVEGSATETGTELALEKENVPAPQQSPVKTVKWTLKDALKSGREFVVNFKVVIQ